MLSLGYLIVFRVVLRPRENLRLSCGIENIPNGILTLDRVGIRSISLRNPGGYTDDFGSVCDSWTVRIFSACVSERDAPRLFPTFVLQLAVEASANSIGAF
jgi:hypothetical protein